MEWIPFSLGELGLVGAFIFLFLSTWMTLGLLVARGHLIPRRTVERELDALVESLKRERDTLATQNREQRETTELFRQAYETEQHARQADARTLAELLEGVRLSLDMLRALQGLIESKRQP